MSRLLALSFALIAPLAAVQAAESPLTYLNRLPQPPVDLKSAGTRCGHLGDTPDMWAPDHDKTIEDLKKQAENAAKQEMLASAGMPANGKISQADAMAYAAQYMNQPRSDLMLMQEVMQAQREPLLPRLESYDSKAYKAPLDALKTQFDEIRNRRKEAMKACPPVGEAGEPDSKCTAPIYRKSRAEMAAKLNATLKSMGTSWKDVLADARDLTQQRLKKHDELYAKAQGPAMKRQIDNLRQQAWQIVQAVADVSSHQCRDALQMWVNYFY